MRPRVPARQVHLDFHTSGLISGVGARFDKRQFQAALREGNVNAINVFAKCHHGWSYYPTKVGNPHPHLSRNLLGEEIEACHEIGVRSPIYFTIGFSVNDVETHPEWCARDKDGAVLPRDYNVKAAPTDPKPIFEWKFLCPRGTYRELILAQTEEICSSFDVDGFWYDICACSGACWCDQCRRDMAVAGRDANDDRQAWEHYVETWRSLMETCNGIIRAKHPGASTYYNGTTQFWTRDFTAHVSQIELEDLPSVGGSYDKFPLAAKHYATRGKALIAMSGKFHTAWGEFGGFKDADALRFETASMVAYGAASSMGDQMHPSGEMDMTTYRLLGKAYRYMESIEDLGMGAEHCANLGFWTSYSMPDDQGTASMLLECQVDFEEASRETEDLGRFRTIVIPGGPCLTEADASRLSAFVAAGGSLLVLGEGALDAGRTRFLLDVGAEYVGPGAYEMDYTLAGPAVAAGLPTSPFVNYAPAPRTRPRDGEVLAAVKEPYFDRTYGHYCSHQNTPCRDEPAAHPAALRKGRVVTLLNSVGRMYGEMGARVHRDWFMAALRLVYADPVQETRLPSAGRANLLHQADRRRYVTHLLYAPPLKRGKCLVIEDMPPILDVPVTLRVPERIRSARLEPQGKSLRMRRAGGAVSVVVPRVQCHQAVAWEY